MHISRTASRLALALMLALAAPVAFSAGGEVSNTSVGESVTLYVGATVIDGTGAAARANQESLVRGERIEAVGPHGTLAGAQAAGQAKDMGSIEAGKLANFAVLSADPVKDIGNLRSIRMTVKRGHVYPRADYRPVTKQEMGDDDD